MLLSDLHGAGRASPLEVSLALPALIELRALPWLAWNIEVVAAVAGYHSARPVISSSVKFLTNRHSFALVVSNTQYIGSDGVLANTRREWDDWIVGFSITRELAL